jgi:hypothetical protein
MAETRIDEIVKLLHEKSCAKQQAYKATYEALNEFKPILEGYKQNLQNQVQGFDQKLEINYNEFGNFEMHMQFAGDTLVFMMHTNIFDFDNSHFIHKTRYLKDDKMREYCGLIQIYNFLSDSLKYKRLEDRGFLIGRIFVNKEKHFFVDGKRPLGFLFNDFESQVMNEKYANKIIEEAILFCLNFDLMVPPYDMVNTISVIQQQTASFSSGFNTSKRMGFQMSGLKQDEE